MAYRLIEHTADLGIEAAADSLEGLFRQCLTALTDCLTRVQQVESQASWTVRLEAPDLGRLLVEFLEEAIYRYETDGVVFADAEVSIRQDGDTWQLESVLLGEAFDLDRHGLGTLVKGVTFHQLRVEKRGAEWTARVIFDI